jgi:hypothetical protein
LLDKIEDGNDMVKAEMLYMLAHTNYRNKQFDQSIEHLNEMKVVLDNCPLSFKRNYFIKTSQLMATNFMLKNKIKKAIEILQDLYEGDYKTSISDEMNTWVNYSMYKYFNDEIKESLKIVNANRHSDKWFNKTMGLEWGLKKNLMELIMYIDLGHNDLAETRLRSIERGYKSLKGNPLYDKAFYFLSLAKKFLFKYDSNTEGFHSQILKTIDFVSYENEDLQSMFFYAWLKSKAINSSMYPTLLGLIK